MRNKRRLMKIGRILILIMFLLLIVIPVYWMFVTSFKTQSEAISLDVKYWPEHFTFDNYKTLLMGGEFLAYLKNSLVVSVVTGAIVTVVAIMGGYGLSRYQYRGKGVTMIGFLITQMIPSTMIMIPMYIILSSMKLTDSLGGLVIYYVALNIPFCVITMQGFFANIPVVIEEAATIDGCTKFQTLTKVVLPIMVPGIVAVFIFAFIGGWNELLGGIMFITSETKRTLPVGISFFVEKYSIQWGEMTAAAIMAMIPSCFLFAVAQKYLVEGMTSGAVKG